MVFRQEIKRSTLDDAKEENDWRPHAAICPALIPQVWKLYLGNIRE